MTETNPAADSITGTYGDDTIFVNRDDVIINAGDGDDFI